MTLFADPYKRCLGCGEWINGTEDVPGPLVLIPCGHVSDYKSLCPSWNPVNGCACTPKGHGRIDIPEGKVP